jgi:hypothetical protein
MGGQAVLSGKRFTTKDLEQFLRNNSRKICRKNKDVKTTLKVMS